MSKLQVDDIVNQEDTGAVEFSKGATSVGVVTASEFSGKVSGPIVINSGISTYNTDVDFNAGIDVDGHTELDDLKVTGVSTFNDSLDINANVNVTGTAATFNNTVNINTNAGIGLSIYKDGNSCYIDNNASGTYIRSRPSGGAPQPIHFRMGANSDGTVAIFSNAGASLYHQGSEKFQTTTDGIEVSGIVTAISGIVTYYGDGSQLTGTGPTHQMVASGSLSNGDLVVLNNDGTVSTVAGTRTSAGIGDTITTPFGNRSYFHGVWDSSNEKLVIASYNNSSGEVVVGTVTGTDITFGTPVTFHSSGVGGFEFDMTYHEGSIVLIWQGPNTGQGTVRVGTVSGDTVNFGSSLNYSVSTQSAAATYDATLVSIPGTSNVVGCYRVSVTSGYERCELQPFSISGNTITAVGTATTISYHPGHSKYPGITYDSTNNKVVTKHLTQFTVSGITANTLYINSFDFDGTNFSNKKEMNVSPETTHSTFYQGLHYDSNTDRLVVTGYPRNDAVNAGVGQNASIAIGEYVSDGYYKFSDFQNVFSTGSYTLESHVSFNSQEQTVGFIYRDYNGLSSADPDHYRPYSYVDFKIDPNTNLIHSSEPISVDFYYSDYNVPQYVHGQINDLVYIPTENRQVAIGASRTAVSTYASSARLITPRVTTTNLTSDNFIGISDGSYTNGQTANIKVVGSISGGHTGLTTGKKYYVDSVGVLTTSKESLADYLPHKYVGVAASSDSIIVKG